MMTQESISDCYRWRETRTQFWLARLMLVLLVTVPAAFVLIGVYEVTNPSCSVPGKEAPSAAYQRDVRPAAPGVFVSTENRHIKGGCYFEHKEPTVVAFSPY
jgi:hypothetical protein